MLELCKPSIKNQKLFLFFLFLISFSFNVLAQPPPIILNTTNETTTFPTTIPFVKLSGGVSNITNLSLNDLLDVSVPAPSNGNFLRFSSVANEWLSSNTTSALHSLNGTTHTGNLSTNRIVKDTGTSFLSQLLDSIIDNLFTTKFNVTGGTITGNVSLDNNNLVDVAKTIFNLTNCEGDEVAGTLCHDVEHDTLKYYTISGQIIQLSQEVTNPMKNKEGSMVMDGSYVYQSGATGENLEFKLAKADNFNTSSMVGVLTTPCEVNEICPVTFFGFVNGIDTSAFSMNDKRYLSATEAGNATTTPPEFPNNIVWMDTVVRVNIQTGRVFVFPKLDTGNGMTFNTIGLIGDFIQTDYKIRSLEGHANLNGKNVMCIEMNGSTGEEVCHITFQPGGNGQASIWTRSGLVVPENLICLNNTNRTDAQCWADAGNFTWNITDFNTTNTEGADWGITGELEVIKGVHIQGNLTTNTIYGGLTGTDIGQVSIGSALVYHNVTNVTQQLSNGFSFNDTGLSELTVQISGVYELNSGWDFSGTANTEYHLAIGINFVRQIDCHAERVIGTGGDVGSSSTTPCIKRLDVGDTINLMIENVDSTTNPTIHNIGLTAKRIGN